MSLLDLQERRDMHEIVTDLKHVKADFYCLVGIGLLGIGSILLFYILDAGVAANCAMSACSAVGFFYLGRAYTIIMRRMRNAQEKYDAAFHPNRIV